MLRNRVFLPPNAKADSSVAAFVPRATAYHGIIQLDDAAPDAMASVLAAWNWTA